jgi:hypothetical protein
MRHDSVLRSSDAYRRPGVARRTNMPPPTYDLNRTEEHDTLNTLLVLTLAVAVTGAGIALIERIGTWLSP